MASSQLDTRIEIVTPENIAFQYQVAGPFRRLGAWLIDLALRAAVVAVCWIITIIVALLLGTIGLSGVPMGVFFVGFFLLDWFYGGLFEMFWNGQTPGKRALRLRVISLTGQPISAWQAILRNLLRPADAMPFFFLFPTFQVGILAMLMNRRFQRLGDIASGTMVVVEEQQRLYGVHRVDEAEVARLAGLLPANFQVSRTMASALSAYVQRRVVFSPARRAEIARHLGEPLRQRFNLPPGTSHDLLLCALYHLAFVAPRPGMEAGSDSTASPFVARQTTSPFAEMATTGR